MASKSFVAAILIAVIVSSIASSAVTYYYVTSTQKPATADKVIYSLNFAPGGSASWLYAGLEQGYFLQQGIALNVVPGTGSSAAIAAVQSGQADFSAVGVDALITAVSQGAAVTAVGLINQYSPAGIAIINSSGVTSPSQLSGKTLLTTAGSVGLALWPAWAKIVNLDPNSVTIQTVAPTAINTILRSGQAVGVIATVYQASNLNAINVSAFAWSYSQFGFNLLGSVLITRTQLIQQNPALVQRFVNAAYQSLAYTVANNAAAVNDLIKYNPTLSVKTETAAWNINQKLMGPSMLGATGVKMGHIDPAAMQTSDDLLSGALKVTEPTATSLYTNQFVGG